MRLEKGSRRASIGRFDIFRLVESRIGYWGVLALAKMAFLLIGIRSPAQWQFEMALDESISLHTASDIQVMRFPLWSNNLLKLFALRHV